MSLREQIDSILQQLNQLIVGKPDQVLDCVTCLLAGGHLLIEDVPGVGKTTLAHGLAHTFGLHFSRVQFTADLMPSDLTGVSVYDRAQEGFIFHPGPIFSQILLADEINRASPKSQSALLEAMEEGQVSAEGATRALPQPFFVIATQNPREQLGTYPLPESQLDRFLMRVSLGYPDRASEKQLLASNGHRQQAQNLRALMMGDDVLRAQQAVLQVHASPALLDYVLDLVENSRSGQWFVQGLSPRAAIALVRVAKARALILGRDHVSPEDVQETIVQTIAHRLVPVAQAGRSANEQVLAMVQATPLR